MKMTLCATGILFTLSAVHCNAAFITQTNTGARFIGAMPGTQTEGEPLRLSAEAFDQVYLLDLGDYTSADAGSTFTVMRQPGTNPDWDAVSFALQTNPGTLAMWLGLDNSVGIGIGSFTLIAGHPTYNLQQVDITPRYYRSGVAGGDTFRTALFDLRLYWLVPEPASWVLVMGAILLLAVRHR
jgi:hypothetical protein